MSPSFFIQNFHVNHLTRIDVSVVVFQDDCEEIAVFKC